MPGPEVQAEIVQTAASFHDLISKAVGGARDWDNRWTKNSFVREIEIYDPVANGWRIVGELPQPTTDATATLLQDGRVWVTGGRYMETHWSDTYLIALP